MEKPLLATKDLETLLQRLILGHPALDTCEIAGRLWGDERIESKRKKLCRKCNPDDRGANFNPLELTRLVEILNDGVADGERAARGGDAVIHFLCRRTGLVATRPPDGGPRDGDALREAMKAMLTLITLLADARDGDIISSAVTFIRQEGYNVQASLQKLMAVTGGAA